MRFNRAVNTYDANATVQNELFKQLKLQLRTHIPTTAVGQLVDLGCATGHHTEDIATTFSSLQVSGIDLESSMIDYANTQYHHPNLTFKAMAIESYLKTSNDQFFFSNATFQWLPNPKKTLTQLKQHTPKLLLFSVFTEGTFHELKTCLSDILNEPITLPVDRFFTGPEWLNLLRSLFNEVRAEHYQFTVPYPNSRALLRHISNTGATQPFPYRTIWTKSLLQKLDASFHQHFGMVRATYHAYIFDVS